jgi:F-type H+-transporting ATPase subunit b
LALIFGALYFVRRRFALPRIGAIIEKRSQCINDDLGEAQRLKSDAEALGAAYEKSLAEARDHAQILAQKRREAEVERADAARTELEAKLDAHVAKAEQKIVQAKIAAMANLGDVAASSASAIVERLIGRTSTERQVTTAVTEVMQH